MASVSGDFKEGGQWTATASSFSGNQTVSLSADVNPLSKVRTADLTISAAGISKSCTVSLTQEASEFEAKLTVVAIPAFAAGGGTYDSVVGTGHVVVKRNGVVIVDNDVRPVFLFKEGGSVSWITFSVTNTSFTVANRALGSGGSRSVTIRAQYTLDVGGVTTLLECDVPISQAANFVETVSVSDASFAYSTIAAKGATVTPTTDSTIAVTMSSGSTLSSASAIDGYTYTLTPSFSMTDDSGFTLNSTTTGSLTAASMGTTLGSRQSPTITYSLSLTYTPSSELSALGAKTVSGSDSSTGTATQGVNEITYSDLTITTFSYFDTSTVLASGGTSVPRLFATETQTYTSGSVASDVPVTGGSFALTTSGHGASVDSSTGVVTYASRGSVAGDAWSDSVTWTLTSHGLTATKSASVSQEANVETFVDFSNAYAADPSYDGRGNIVVVTGGTVTATPGARLSYTSGSTVVKDVSASSTSEPVALGSGASWDASSWTLTIPSAGTSVYPEDKSYSCAIKVTTPYGTTYFYMYRQANLQTLTGIRLAAPSVSGDSWISDWSAVPAAGGNLACAGYNQYSYTSGSTNEVRITDFRDVTVNTSESWVEVLDDDATYPMSLHVLSRGEIAGDARSSDVSWTCAGFTSNSLSFMQVANVKTFTKIVARSTSSNPPTGIPDIDTRFWVAANGGVLTVSFIAKYSYSSGSSSEDVVSSGVSTEYYMTSPSATWDSANQTMTYISAGTNVTPVVYTSINFTYNELTGTTSFGRQANEATYDVPVLTLSYSDIAASGGSVTPSKSFTQSVSYTSGSTSTVTSGGSWSYSGTNVNTSTGAVSASALGYTVKARTKITDATATVTVNGKSGSASAAVYQQENYVLSIAIKGQNWVTPVSPTLSFPAEGDTNSYTCYGTFTSGTVRVQNSALDDWELSNSVFTKALNTALVLTVTAPSCGTTAGSARTSTLTVTLNTSATNNKTLTDSVTLTQEANAIVSYDTPVVSLAYADIPAGGGSVTPTKSFTQTTTYTSGSTGSISSGGTWSYSGTDVDTSTGAVSGTSLGTTEVSRTKKTDATATITINGKSGSATVGVYQEANTIESVGPVTITGAVVDDIPAGGGTISEFTAYGWTQDVTYTSGVTVTSNYHTTSYSDPVTASSLGTTVKPRAKVGTLTLEVVGEKNESATLTLDVYQEANTATYARPTITASYDDDIPAGGGTVSLTKSFTQRVTYTSGSIGTVSSGGTWAYSQSSGSGLSLNTSTGAVTAASLGTTAKVRTQIAEVMVSLGANGLFDDVTCDVYQEANEVTYSDPIVTHTSPISVAASAGQYQLKPNFTQRAYYTSGSETSILSGSFTYAVNTALTGFTLAPSTGIVSYTANPSVSPRNGFVVTITGSGNSKSGTTDVTFNQEGVEPEIYVSLNGTRYGSSVTVNLEGKSASEVSVYVKTNDTFDVS